MGKVDCHSVNSEAARREYFLGTTWNIALGTSGVAGQDRILTIC